MKKQKKSKTDSIHGHLPLVSQEMTINWGRLGDIFGGDSIIGAP